MDLDNAIRIDSALDSIKLKFTRAEHVGCYKVKYQPEQAAAWDAAIDLVATLGSVKKAQNFVNRAIEQYR